MHAMEGSSSYFSATIEHVGYREVSWLGKSDDSGRKKSPSVVVWVVGGRVKKILIG